MEKKKNTPKLRFPEFTGEWEEKKLGQITTKLSDGLHSTPKYTDDSVYYFINGNNLINGKVIINENTKKVELEEYLKHKKELNNTSILISINGTIGSLALYENEQVILGKSACYINVIESIDRLFIYSTLQTSNVINYFTSELSGTTIKNLSLTSIKNTVIKLPSLAEQTKIATFLTAVDEKLTQLKKKKALLEQYKKGVMQKLFSQELRFKDDNNQDFPDWQEKTLGEIAIFINGRAYKQEELLEKGKYPVLRVGNLNSNNYWYYSDLELDDDKYCDNGDLLYAWSASFGPKIWNEGKMIYHYHIWKVLCTELVLLKYLYYVLDEQTMKMKTSSTNGFALLHITKETIEKWIVILPSFPEQQKIANFFSSIDEKIDHCVKQIEKMDTWKKGLLQQMFC